jgi:hypothetical protein
VPVPCGRDDNSMSETMRNVLSAFLYRTGPSGGLK